MKRILCDCFICSKLPEDLRQVMHFPETGPVTVTETSEMADYNKSEAQHSFRITPETIRQHNPYTMDYVAACSFFNLYRRDFDAVLSNALAEYVRSKMSPQQDESEAEIRSREPIEYHRATQLHLNFTDTGLPGAGTFGG